MEELFKTGEYFKYLSDEDKKILNQYCIVIKVPKDHICSMLVKTGPRHTVSSRNRPTIENLAR